MGLTGGLALLAAVQIAATPAAADAQAVAAPAQLPRTPWTLRIGPQRPDLVRYNRAEGLSFGVRGQLRPRTPAGPLSISATARLGTADVHPNGRLDIAHEDLDRRIVVSGYHELAAIDERARHFGLANSLMGLLYGQDDGDYYRRSGASVEWTPPAFERRSFRLRLFTEYHEHVDKATDAQLPRLWDEGRAFRDNVGTEERWDVGASLEIRLPFGGEPGEPPGGITIYGELVQDYWRYAQTQDVVVSLPGRLRWSLEAEAMVAGGDVPNQKRWYLGGPLTLRGYAPRSVGATAAARGRVELDRAFSFGRIGVFADAAWTGEGLGDDLYSAGLGLALIDDILRIDVARQLQSARDFRLDVYLDQIL